MSSALATVGRTGIRTRLLGYGLLGVCATMVLYGPSVAEAVLDAAGCPGPWGSAAAGCQGLALLPASALAPWLSVAPPVDTTFLLLQQTWPLIAGWLALIALSIFLDGRRGPQGAAQPGAARTAESRGAVSTGNGSFAAQQAEWIRQKQAEQAHEQSKAQLSFHRRMLAEGALLGSLWIGCIVLLGGLAVFCLALGIPLVGGVSAESLLHALGCSDQAQMASSPWSGTCGFWIDRLEPYQRPWFGALLSPVWLFTEFSDVLLIWMASALFLVLLLVYRVGWSVVPKRSLRVLAGAGLVVFGAALLGQLHQFSRGASAPLQSMGDSGLGSTANVVEFAVVLGAVFLLALVAALIAIVVATVAVAWRFIRMREQARLEATTQAKPGTPPS